MSCWSSSSSALLLTPLLIRRFGSGAGRSRPTGDRPPRSQYGFRLTESAKAAGPRLRRTRRRRSTRSWRTSCRRWRRWARPSSVVDVDRDGQPISTSPTARKARRNRLYRNRGRRHVRGRRRARSASPTSTEPAPACRWARSGATTTTTASRTCSSTAGAGPSCFTTTAAAASRASASGRPAGLGEHQHRGLARLRPRRPARSFLGGYCPETVNLWKLADTKMMPESFEYANNGGRKYLFRNLGGGRFEEVSEQVGLELAPLGAGRRRRRPARHRLSRTSSSPTTTACRSCSSTRAARFREVGRETRRRLRAEERHERVGRRRAQPGRASRSTCRTSPRKASCSRATTSGCRPAPADGAAAVREPGARDGRRPRRLELRRAVRRSEQRRLPRPLPRQRLRLGVEDRQLLVRLLEDRRRPRDRHLGREELAGDGRRAAWPAISRRRSGSTTAPAASPTSRRWSASTDRYDGRSVALADLGEPRRARRRSSPTSAARCCSIATTSRPAATGSPSISRAAAGRTAAAGPCTNRSAIGARVTRVLERPAAGAGSVGRIGLLRAEPAPPALRAGRGAGGRQGGRPLAVGQDAGAAAARSRTGCTSSRSRHDDRRQRRRPSARPASPARASTSATSRRS